MSEVLSLKDISKVYNPGKPNEIIVLSEANITIKAGEVVGLIAPSGAGKSTLLHIAGLLDAPDSGMVAISGQDQTGKSDRKRTRTRRIRLVSLTASAHVHDAKMLGLSISFTICCRNLPLWKT